MKKIANQLWIQKDQDAYRLGLTEELQSDAGEISYANIAPLGLIEMDDTLIVLEATKASIEIPVPFAGEIVERHEQVESQPSLLDSVKDEDNWIVVMKNINEELYQSLPNF